MKINIFFIIASLMVTQNLPVTFVYNLKIAETTKRQAIASNYRKPNIAALTVIDQYRERLDGARQNTAGALGTYIYSSKNYYVRTDFAFANVSERLNNTRFSRTQTDDLLFTAGYTQSINERMKLTFSGMLGIPTHNDTVFEGIQFGTGHVGLGFQGDGSFVYSPDHNHSILAAARFVHFFSRNVHIPIGPVAPEFTFYLGNVADLFIAHHSNWKTQAFEFGYNATFGFGAQLCPTIAAIINRQNFMRNSFFATYRYGFLFYDHLSAVILGGSYAYDQKPKDFGMKNIFTFWATWGINF